MLRRSDVLRSVLFTASVALISGGCDAGAALGPLLTGSGCRTLCWDPGSFPPSKVSQVPVRVATDTAFTRIASNGYGTCALTAAGVSFCWGRNFANAEPAYDSLPVRRSSFPLATAISAGADRYCMVAGSGGVRCWGHNPLSRLTGSLEEMLSSPTSVSGGDSLVLVSVKGGYDPSTRTASLACGLTASGRALCWGANEVGQLGQPSVGGESLVPVEVAGGRRYSAVTVGDDFACALDGGGAAWCWGSGSNGQIGVDTSSIVGTPRAVPGGHVFTSISAGQDHVCALADGGAAWCWGDGSSGEIGSPSMLSGVPALEPRRVMGMPAARQVVAGARYTCALSLDGEAYCWGSSSSFQLGVAGGDTWNIPVSVNTTTRFSTLSLGTYTTCGLALDGLAWCWGLGDGGRLGSGM